jgi:putative restriction endonuclease
MFDNGGFKINDDFTLIGIEGALFVDASHKIEAAFLAYHRET